MNHRSRSDKFLGAAILVALVILGGSLGVTTAAGCKADIEAEFRKENEGSDHKAYIWKVDVTTEEVCADVEFSLWTREIDGDGNETEKTSPSQIKVSSREVKSRKVNHVVPLGTKVADWRFEITKCTPCDG